MQSHTLRNLLTILMVLLMALAAFAAGYLTHSAVGTLQPDAADLDFALLREAWGHVQNNYSGALPTSREAVYGAIRGALDTLNDPYTYLVEPAARDAERDNLRGIAGGIGLNVMRNDEGQLILTPSPDNPAAKAGVRAGDILVAIDGDTLSADITVPAILDRLAGEKGTAVTLTLLQPPDATPRTITIIRDEILIPSVAYRLLEDAPTIGYIQLNRFSEQSGREVRDAILALRALGATRLILDLRHNGGGLLQASVDVSANFLADATIYVRVSRDAGEETQATGKDVVAPDEPLVILVDGGTASSSEIVAGALQDYGRAVLIGSPTYGKGSVQLIYDLSDGSSIHVTSSRWYTPQRRQIDQHGLQPDIEVVPSQAATADGRDETLERAVAYLETGQ